jgi:type I restriction-modification system DNA methylase subunit
MSISSSIKSIQDIMRKDVGVDGDAQRIEGENFLLRGRHASLAGCSESSRT